MEAAEALVPAATAKSAGSCGLVEAQLLNGLKAVALKKEAALQQHFGKEQRSRCGCTGRLHWKQWMAAETGIYCRFVEADALNRPLLNVVVAAECLLRRKVARGQFWYSHTGTCACTLVNCTCC